MKALIDKQLSPQIASQLRSCGPDVSAVAEREDLIGRSDRPIFELAGAEGGAMITNNVKDFRPLATAITIVLEEHPEGQQIERTLGRSYRSRLTDRCRPGPAGLVSARTATLCAISNAEALCSDTLHCQAWLDRLELVVVAVLGDDRELVCECGRCQETVKRL